MKIFIAGIVHFDVLGPDKLKKWFQESRDSNEGPPEFVAVEWDESVFKQIIFQRSLIRKYAKKVWPTATSEFLDKIETSLGYEGDIHKQIFPDVETLWLDKDRPLPDISIVSQYARDRMNIYKSYYKKTPQDFDLHKTLMHMSKEAWDQSSPPEAEGNDRDIKFSKAIINRMNQSKVNWSIVVVGASHARFSNGFMAKLLSDAGLYCYVKTLNQIQGIL